MSNQFRSVENKTTFLPKRKMLFCIFFYTHFKKLQVSKFLTTFLILVNLYLFSDDAFFLCFSISEVLKFKAKRHAKKGTPKKARQKRHAGKKARQRYAENKVRQKRHAKKGTPKKGTP